jgi:hypothetical protein
MHIKQNGTTINFGTPERQITLTKGFSGADVDAAVAELSAAYPDEAATVERYGDRLRRMVRS